MFRASGGEIITTGSDAHIAGFVGTGISDAVERLKLAGFGKSAFFRKREPIMAKIK
jgi:histidinol-phosphatase (PHP family)